MFNKIQKGLMSRTNWVIILMAIFNGISSVQEQIPAEMQLPVSMLLGLMAIYFKMNPSQEY